MAASRASRAGALMRQAYGPATEHANAAVGNSQLNVCFGPRIHTFPGWDALGGACPRHRRADPHGACLDARKTA